MQAFDVADLVGAVGAKTGAQNGVVCDGDVAVTIDIGAHPAFDQVVTPDVGVECRVEVSGGRLQYLAHDTDLAGVDGTGQHLGLELGHAVGTKEFDVGVQSITDGKADIQPGIAVDEVVTTSTFDDVAAGTTQDDVAAGELRDNRIEQRVEPVL